MSSVGADEARRLRTLKADVRDQDDLERDITRQADKALAERAEENDTKRLEKALNEKARVESQMRTAQHRLQQPVGAVTRRRIENELRGLEVRKNGLAKDVIEIQKRIDERREKQENPTAVTGSGRQPNESRRDYLIRTGKITPFAAVNTDSNNGPLANLHDALIDVEDRYDEDEERDQLKDQPTASHVHLARPGFGFDEVSADSRSDSTVSGKGKRRKLDSSPEAKKRPRTRVSTSPSADSSASYVASEDADDVSEGDDFMPDTVPEPMSISKRKKDVSGEKLEDFSGVDDGNETIYQSRLTKWISKRSSARKRAQKETLVKDEYEDDEEWLKPHPTIPDEEITNGLRIPGDINRFLFGYQRTAVRWLWELHQQKVGGIIGDEMGLGKTIQAIAYLASLHHSKMFDKPALVVCPATLMEQWVNEFHRWWPPFRVSILHSSGSGMVNLGKETTREEALTAELMGSYHSRHLSSSQKPAKKIINRVVEEGHVLVTTYSGLQSYADVLVGVEWGCAILDEGHKIRNPDAGITFSCKELRTPHRIILSGTPMQNSLVDLWSLFDFVFPMRLGNLVNFKSQFEIPIRQGGYASASNLQVQTATKCAETLKDAISPYLLQRFKADVAKDLPQKSEQVIFCNLTQWQRTIYRRFLESDDMKSIHLGKRNALFGIDLLRKICNHPDLADHALRSKEADYGNSERSGKMQVLKGLLEVWRDTRHKTLLFAQTRQVLDILEKFIRWLGDFNYRRMDGTTPIKDRQSLVDRFNTDPSVHVFLLTTKVGGIGINLTGADRVIIYDPDWNPSTDMQARERAWRLGQKRDVTIFRLMTKGTIEEKIYHRQIFKQFLTNKITRDPQSREGFNLSDLYDLFTLSDEHEKGLETTKLFKDAQVTYREEPKNELAKPHAGQPKPLPESLKEDDINAVPGVVTIEEFKNDSEDPEKEGNVKNAEDRIMQGIFARSNVHAALEHEEIVNGKRKVRADPKMVEAEARRVANEAAEELRKAGETARTVPIGLPTWTGQFGVAGRNRSGGSSSSARPAGAGPSSASLVANLNPRASVRSADSSSPAPTRMPRGKDFLAMIRDYIASCRGPVYSQMLIDEFSHYCNTPQRIAEFQEMLKKVATLSRAADGRGKWTLNPEFTRKHPAGRR
ncbi:uncharacterized protein PFLUO_LOCUS4 [Penicillium psychrofluorescens]|uniref:uncharacterized protein n=1 Tax=Penicillium psychrofluorescens TaxID=3158075 RepID=UPI003CCCB49E